MESTTPGGERRPSPPVAASPSQSVEAPSRGRRKARTAIGITAITLVLVLAGLYALGSLYPSKPSSEKALGSLGVDVNLPEGWKTRGINGLFVATSSTAALDSAESLIKAGPPGDAESRLAECKFCNVPLLVIAPGAAVMAPFASSAGTANPGGGNSVSEGGAAGAAPAPEDFAVIEGPELITIGNYYAATITLRHAGRIERHVFINMGNGRRQAVSAYLPESAWSGYQSVLQSVVLTVRPRGTNVQPAKVLSPNLQPASASGNSPAGVTAPPPPPPPPAPSAPQPPPPPAPAPPPPPPNPPAPPPAASSGQETLTKGWDSFTTALSGGSVSWTAGPGSLQTVFTLSGAPPNTTFTAGAHFFPSGTVECPYNVNFNAGTHAGTTCNGSREGVTSTVDGWDFGTLRTDANGNASIRFNLTPRAGTYRTQFTVRIGSPCPPNCAVAYRSGGRFATSFAIIVVP